MTAWQVDGLEAEVGRFRLGPVDLSLGPGEAVAVVGASGAGKTTVLRALGGFLDLRRGRILRDGVDLTGWPPERRRLGYVPQGLGLLPHRTAEENVRYPLELRERADAAPRARALLERFDLGSVAGRRPDGLSGGEAQRVALARALAADPELILWDEPSQALDVGARHELALVLRDLTAVERLPVVLVTHDPALAFSTADRFLLLERGRVQAACDARALLAAPPDPFAARFVGYENVFDAERIARDGTTPFGRWIAERAGPTGLALGVPPPGPGPFAGRTVGVRPTPQGLTIEVVVDGFPLVLRQPTAGSGSSPAVGALVSFDPGAADVHPLGRSAGGAEGRP